MPGGVGDDTRRVRPERAVFPPLWSAVLPIYDRSLTEGCAAFHAVITGSIKAHRSSDKSLG